MNPIASFFTGAAFTHANAASSLIAGTADFAALSAGLAAAQGNLRQTGAQDLRLAEFHAAVDEFVNVAGRGNLSAAHEARTKVSTAVGSLPNSLWRLGTQATARDVNLVYLSDTLTALRRIMGSRPFLKTGAEDQGFMRTVAGGLSTFLTEAPGKNDIEIAGKVEETAAQIQDAAVQTLAAELKLVFPIPLFEEREPAAPARPAPTPESSPVTAPPTPASQPSEASEPAPPSPFRVPFDYHPDSESKLESLFEIRAAGVARRIESEGVPWPYDFVRWVRSLYLWAGETPNGESARVRKNISRGIARLQDLPTLEVGDIRRLLGPSAVSVGHPPVGVPDDWPTDLPNDVGTTVITLWDYAFDSQNEPFGALIYDALELWRKSPGLPNEAEIRGELKSIFRSLEQIVSESDTLVIEDVNDRLIAISERLFPEDQRPALGVRRRSSAPPPEAGARMEPISPAEWTSKALDFVIHENRKLGSLDLAGALPGAVRHLVRHLPSMDPFSEQAKDSLSLLFHVTLSLRRMFGVAGEAALALDRDADEPVGFADQARAQEIVQSDPIRTELLQELADETNKDLRAYQPLLGPNGLPELVGRYVEYVRRDPANALAGASRDFAERHPELGLTSEMVRSLLAYFVGIIDGAYNETLFREIVQGLPGVEQPTVDAREGLGEALFRDIDPDKYTRYGQVFIKVVADHRPKLTNQARIMMTIVAWLERIHRAYRLQIRESGNSNFDRAYAAALAKSKHLGNDVYKNQHRQLFSELLDFLGHHRDVADLVESSLLAGEIAIAASKPRAIRTAGGPPGDQAPEEVRTAAAEEESLPPVPAGPKSAEPLAAEATESIVPSDPMDAANLVAPVVSPDAHDSVENPFALESDPAAGILWSEDVEPAAGEPTAAPSVTEPPPTSSEEPSPDVQAALSIPLPPAQTEDAAPSAAPIPVREPREAPPSVRRELPDAIESYVQDWGLTGSHRAALRDMLEHATQETVLAVLQNIERGNNYADRRRLRIEEYGRASDQQRLTTRAKGRLLDLMASDETFGRVGQLLPVAAAKPAGVILDRILPEPLQLGRRFGRFVSTQGGDQTAAVHTRPAVTPDEGAVEEKAVMPSGAGVLAWNSKSAPLHIGVRNDRVIGDFGLIKMIIKARGSVESSKRTSITFIAFAPKMTNPARAFFFSQHPKGTLIVWWGGGFSVHRLVAVDRAKKNGPETLLENIVEYQRDGSGPVSVKTVSLEGVPFPIVSVGETDWNPETHRQIEQPTSRAMKRLEELKQGRLSARMKALRDAAIQTVGFLKPSHADATGIIAVCQSLNHSPDLGKEKAVEIMGQLEDSIRKIEGRFAEDERTSLLAALPPIEDVKESEPAKPAAGPKTTVPETARWNPESVSWSALFKERGISEAEIWPPLREVLRTRDGLYGEPSYDRLSQIICDIGMGIESHLADLEAAGDSFSEVRELFSADRIPSWKERISAIELEALEAFDLQDDEAQGIQRILKLPDILRRAREVAREIVAAELEGYDGVAARLGAEGSASELAEFFRLKFEELMGSVPNPANPILDASLFNRLVEFRKDLQRRAYALNVILRRVRPARYRFHSREDLELPPDRIDSRGLCDFMERYGFLVVPEKSYNNKRIYRHPGTGITQEVPMDVERGSGFRAKNFRNFAVRAVEDALRRSGLMAPAAETAGNHRR